MREICKGFLLFFLFRFHLLKDIVHPASQCAHLIAALLGKADCAVSPFHAVYTLLHLPKISAGEATAEKHGKDSRQ